MPVEPIRLMVADDDREYRSRVRQAVMLTQDIDLIAQAEDGMTAVDISAGICRMSWCWILCSPGWTG